MTTVYPGPTGVSTVPADEEILALHSEDLVVGKRLVERFTVRVATVTHSHDRLVEEELTHRRVEIVHVPMGYFVDAVPPVREEGDLTIMPVVEEVVIVERRLLLKEEVHIRRVRQTEQHVETVAVRRQEAVVTRTPIVAAGETPFDTGNQKPTSGTSKP
ncbi:MAG: DUF2382 domain-containing protein [Janthinobacterium lividum]